MDALYGGEMPLIQAGLHIFLGLLFCFFGYGMYRTFLRTYGLLMGFFVGLVLGAVAESTTVTFICAGAGGLVGFIIVSLFYFVGLFITGGLAGAISAALPVAALELTSPAPEIGAAMAGFVLGGILAVRFEKTIMVVLTAVYGVAIAGIGLNGLNVDWLFLGPKPGSDPTVFVWSASALVVRGSLLVLGIGCQSAIVRKLDRRKPITQYW